MSMVCLRNSKKGRVAAEQWGREQWQEVRLEGWLGTLVTGPCRPKAGI